VELSTEVSRINTEEQESGASSVDETRNQLLRELCGEIRQFRQVYQEVVRIFSTSGPTVLILYSILMMWPLRILSQRKS
jgi:hypothetical protein